MAEEFVRKEHFEEFVKRMESGLAHVNELADQRYDSMTQRLADAEKAREQNFVYLNQRFDDMNRSVNQRFDGLEKRFDDQRRIILLMLSTIVAAAIGAMVKVFFFS